MSAELRDQLQATLGHGYTLERELGGGGMSRVFVANDTTLGRRVVVKVLPSELAASVSVSRFQREIQLAAQLQHPHIVPVLSAGVSEGLPYYTMPFVEGESLRVRLSRTGELPVHEAVGILRDVVKALAYAHRHGVVHRDIKPENVLLTEDAALVADFGVAKALSASTQGDAGAPHGTLTSLGIALGTPAYMSPEQASADPHTDHRADIYAVGMMAYELLVGQTPFGGRTPQAILAAQVNETPVPIAQRRPTIPGSLASLVTRCLEKRPADRPQSAGELLQVLDALVTPSGGATPTGMAPAATGARLSARTIGAIAAAAVVILATGVLLAQRSARPTLVRDRVLIVPFVDKTGDPSLASLSPMIADWITRSLRDSRVAEVAPMPQTSATATGDLTVQRIRELAKGTGASTIIGGTIYRMGDSIQLTANVADARREEVVQSIAVAALAKSPMSAIDGMRSRIVGVLAARLDTSITDIAESTSQPPSYEAYREYLTGDDAFRRGDYQTALRGFLAAASLDSTFTFPLVRAAYSYANLASREALEYDPFYVSKIDSINRALATRRNRMSAFDVAYLDRVLGWVHGDFNASYEAGKRMAAIAPRSDFARYVAARSAIPVNQLHAAAAGFEAMERDGSLTTSREVNFYNDLATVYHRLGEYDKELETARRGIAKFPQRNRPVFNELQALAALGRTDEALRKAEAYLGRPRDAQDEPADLTATVAAELLWHGHPAAAKALAQRTLAVWKSVNTRDSLAGDRGPRVMLTPALIAGDFAEAERLLDVARRQDATFVIVGRGILAARRGDTATADAALARLERTRGPYLRSAHIIGQARIAAALGRRDRAVELLRQALANGASFDNNVHGMPEFAPYANHPPLLALFKSKD